VLVVGDGGIGKTRLVAELAAGLAGFDVLYGRCDEEELFPYGPWVDMLRPRFDRMGEAELAVLLGPEATGLARLMPEIGERLPGAAEPPAGGDSETERRLLFGAVTRVLGRLAAQRPQLVVIDDLHWADRSSLLLARHLARQPRLGPMLMVGTYRDAELEPGHALPDLIADVERDRPVPRVRLGGMDEREVAAADRLLARHGGRGRRVAAIRTETEGNPFFVKQLVRHLEEVGRQARTWRLRRARSAGGRARRDRAPRRPPARRAPTRAQRGGADRPRLRVRAARARGRRPADELLDVLDSAVRGGAAGRGAEHARPLFVRRTPCCARPWSQSSPRPAGRCCTGGIGEAIEQAATATGSTPGSTSLPATSRRRGAREADRAVDYARPAPPRRPPSASPSTRRCGC
jgi:hypothetical protein